MDSRFNFVLLIPVAVLLLVPASLAQAVAPGQSSSSSSSSSSSPSGNSSSSVSVQHARKAATGAESRLDVGSVSNGAYRNKTFGFACKLPAGWVLRTEEMNARGDGDLPPTKESRAALDRTAGGGCLHTSSCVLLAAFSRPPEARGEDVNSSILIAAESAASYPGLKEAAQYFGPVTEIAQAQGFEVVNEPYEFVLGTKTVAREDFLKDVGTRVMRQSTLVILGRGYVVSFTFIGGTEDEVEELVEGLSFGVAARPAAK
jgi:hypothetical protein